jgi:hypothetical protein
VVAVSVFYFDPFVNYFAESVAKVHIIPTRSLRIADYGRRGGNYANDVFVRGCCNAYFFARKRNEKSSAVFVVFVGVKPFEHLCVICAARIKRVCRIRASVELEAERVASCGNGSVADN